MPGSNAAGSSVAESETSSRSAADPNRVAPPGVLHVALPKGRMQEGVFALLKDAGVSISASARGYRPVLSLPDTEAKILKPQNIIEMLHIGSRDVGFAGADWVAELEADLVDLLDTRLDPVRLVAAAPEAILGADGSLPTRPLVVASEYTRLTRGWIASRSLDATFVRSYGATEVFPPEDADCIVDNTATGSTLRANGLAIVDEVMRSSTRLYASRAAMDDGEKRARIEELVLVVRSVLDARQRVLIELNVDADRLDAVVDLLPCMREPTVASLHTGSGYAVRAAVPRRELAALIPKIKAAGGADVIVTPATHIVS